jgi:hypothetical protein
MARAGACDAADHNDCHSHVNYWQVFGYASSIRQHTPAYVRIRQHTPAYVKSSGMHTHAQSPPHTRPNAHTHTQNRHFNHCQVIGYAFQAQAFFFPSPPLFFVARVWYATRSLAYADVCGRMRTYAVARVWYATRSLALRLCAREAQGEKCLISLFVPHSHPCDFRWGGGVLSFLFWQ